ncbi:type II toxin-antitoxin system ParD family antitoxin, partial [Klebsiella pneumoniae]|nr:type II toxin-antitoxin system ParD family antitoxin [Klebsiella pneumoniae]
MARTMTVDVGDELREFIDSLVKAGDYRTQSEVMRDALRLLREKQ